MMRHLLRNRQLMPISSLFRQMHISTNSPISQGVISHTFVQKTPVLGVNFAKYEAHFSSPTPFLNQSRPQLEIPINALIRPSIGIPPEMLERSTNRTPVNRDIIAPIEIPTTLGNIDKEIEDSPTTPVIEKQAARLIVIRRIKMNKHKLKKLRKKMKYIWAKVKLRRAIRKEKAYLNEKMDMIRAARSFDAKQYVANIIKKAKEEPIPRKWQDPLMPEEFKEQEMKKEAWEKRYQKMINLYLNRNIKIKFFNRKY